MTAAMMAEKLGISAVTMSAIDVGRKKLSEQMLEKLETMLPKDDFIDLLKSEREMNLPSFLQKKFEKYNDYVFEIIGYLADWGRCSSGSFHAFDYYRQKTAEEFKQCVIKELTENYEENPDVRTKMTVAEIEKEFLTRVLTR